MLREVERFLSLYPNLISTLSALGTIGAVIVSLWLAHKQGRSKVTAYVNTGRLIPPGNFGKTINPKDFPSCITVHITNHGPFPIYLNYFTSFFWRLPFARVQANQNPAQPIFNHEALEIQAGKSVPIVLTDQPDESISSLRKEKILGKNLLGIRFRFLSLFVQTSDGQIVKAKMGKDLRQFIKEDTVNGR